MSAARRIHGPLDAKGRHALADALGDTPETVISVHQLRRGLCRAWTVGNPSRFDAAIIQGDFLPEEPVGFGVDAERLWELLKPVEGWECIDVSQSCAAALGKIIERETGVRVRYYDDIYHTLGEPAPDFPDKHVRRLTSADLALLESAPHDVQGCGFEGLDAMLSEGVAACAIVDGDIVAIAHTYARSERHADVGVYTLEDWRGRGYATACAAVVARAVQEAGQTPVWSTGPGNLASLRVAEKLGFKEVARTTYVILEQHKQHGA